MGLAAASEFGGKTDRDIQKMLLGIRSSSTRGTAHRFFDQSGSITRYSKLVSFYRLIPALNQKFFAA
jgi:hypothetical protein